MRKTIKNRANNLKIKRANSKSKAKIFIKTFLFSLCVVSLTFLLAPLFGVNIITPKQEKLSAEYFIIYTNITSNEQTDVWEQSQKLRSRGAGGNVARQGNNSIIVLTECESLGKTRKVLENLATQEIQADYYAHKIEIDLNNFSSEQKQIATEFFNTKVLIIKNIFEYLELIENNKKNETDVLIEFFSLYYQLNIQTQKWAQFVDEKTISFQSHLFLLSQNKTESNSPFASTIRYYLFKLINLI